MVNAIHRMDGCLSDLTSNSLFCFSDVILMYCPDVERAGSESDTKSPAKGDKDLKREDSDEEDDVSHRRRERSSSRERSDREDDPLRCMEIPIAAPPLEARRPVVKLFAVYMAHEKRHPCTALVTF